MRNVSDDGFFSVGVSGPVGEIGTYVCGISSPVDNSIPFSYGSITRRFIINRRHLKKKYAAIVVVMFARACTRTRRLYQYY